MTTTPRLIAVMGPTGSGKSVLAEALARHYGAALINADASQVYRGLDIGTAKPKNRADYHLLDLIEPNESFGVGQWVKLAHSLLTELYKDGKSAVIVGGTGLYIRALFEEYSDLADAPDPSLRASVQARYEEVGLAALIEELKDRSPELAAKTDLCNPTRVMRAMEKLQSPRSEPLPLPQFLKIKLAISPTPEDLDMRLKLRLIRMFEQGWIEEVRTLVHQGIHANAPGMRAIGYGEIANALEGEFNEEELFEKIYLRTRQYAKRQRTWLRSEPNLIVLRNSNVFEDVITETIQRIESMAKG